MTYGNSGPALEIWSNGDRVYDRQGHGTVASAPLSAARTAFQTNFVWVRWDDGEACYVDPNSLDKIIQRGEG